jgi:F-type H+-transporting ATPase subunit b
MMRKETEELKNMLTKNAKKDAEKVLFEANLVAEKKLNLAEKQIELEYKKVESEIKESIKDLAFTAAKKIIKKEIDEKTHKRIIEETLDEGIKNQFK